MASSDLATIDPPAHVRIDATAHCQLKCPSCPTASGATKPVLGAGHLGVRELERLLDENPSIAEVELSNYGEMFLNPRLDELIRAAHDRGVVLHADNGTNLNFAKESVLEALARYRFRSITCSIDGASQETYAKYRVGGDLETVLGHIGKIEQHKREHSTPFPRLKWQFVVFGHNEHEIDLAQRMAADRGMAFVPKLSWDETLSPVRDRALVQLRTGRQSVSREEHKREHGANYMRKACTQLWHQPALNWDGKNLGCSRNFWGDFGGNAFSDGVDAVVNGERMVHARRMLMGQAPERGDVPCTTCELYLDLKARGNWLEPREVAPVARTTELGVVIPAGEASAARAYVSVFAAASAAPVATSYAGVRDGRACAYYRLEPGAYTISARIETATGGALRVAGARVVVAARPVVQEMRLGS